MSLPLHLDDCGVCTFGADRQERNTVRYLTLTIKVQLNDENQDYGIETNQSKEGAAGTRSPGVEYHFTVAGSLRTCPKITQQPQFKLQEHSHHQIPIFSVILY